MDYREAEAYINNIPKFSKEKSRENTAAILAYFGHPERSFSYIHVAGTNGKGSVCAYLDSMLRAAGKRTGLFTSPHLVTTTERMKVNGEDVSAAMFVSIFEELLVVVKDRMAKGHPHPTYFEWLYLMAMIWFGRCHIEYGVIETGLGGRLDATNLIECPVLTVITSISYDHMEYLGGTLTEIAGEKAGIIKAGVPVICDGSEEEAVAVIEQKAEKMHAPLTILRPQQIKNILNRGKNIDFCLEDMYHERYSIHLHTKALYQTMNSSLAWLAMKQLMKQDTGLGAVGSEVLLAGLTAMHWPGRLEELLPGVYVDGAHNVGGVRMLAESLCRNFAGRPLWIVFAVASDKDYGHMIEQLCRIPDLQGVIVTELANSRKTDLQTVAAIFEKKWHGYVGQSYNINEAIIEGRRRAGDSGMLVCAGSLYLAGSVIEALTPQEGQADD